MSSLPQVWSPLKQPSIGLWLSSTIVNPAGSYTQRQVSETALLKSCRGSDILLFTLLSSSRRRQLTLRAVFPRASAYVDVDLLCDVSSKCPLVSECCFLAVKAPWNWLYAVVFSETCTHTFISRTSRILLRAQDIAVSKKKKKLQFFPTCIWKPWSSFL